MYDSDTIAAISTSLGNSGINIIRISGGDSFNIVSKLFRKGKSLMKFEADKYESHTIHYGYFYYEDNCIDEVIISLFKAPHSYTTEDIVEINCHGGSFVAKAVLEAVVMNGARIAAPGEFSKRAFLNGRIDLSQAEAVMDIIKSQNDYSLKSSINHLKGDIKKTIQLLRESLLNEVAFIEAALDDPEHFTLDNYSESLLKIVEEVRCKIKGLSDSYNDGRVMSEGINTVIVGKPNVGKSSIMNFLLRDDKAIVTDIPGTTRDVIEYKVNLGLFTLNLIDTAGIHSTDNIIEKIGIEKTYESIENADLVLCVFDNSRMFEEEDIKIYNMIKNKRHIVICNKIDLNSKLNFITESAKTNICIDFSVKENIGYDTLVSAIESMFYSGRLDIENEVYITNIRHAELLKKSLKSLDSVIDGINLGISEDLFSIDIMDAYSYLGEIIGEAVTDDLADKIFSDFCMGK